MQITQIEVTVAPDGRVAIHVRGVKGTACRSLTSGLEQALGAGIQSRTTTAEAYETPLNELQSSQDLSLHSSSDD